MFIGSLRIGKPHMNVSSRHMCLFSATPLSIRRAAGLADIPFQPNSMPPDGLHHILSCHERPRLHGRSAARHVIHTTIHETGIEELVAEISAAILCAHAGIMQDEQWDNSATYVNSWLQALENNPTWIIKASSIAEKAATSIAGKEIG